MLLRIEADYSNDPREEMLTEIESLLGNACVRNTTRISVKFLKYQVADLAHRAKVEGLRDRISCWPAWIPNHDPHPEQVLELLVINAALKLRPDLTDHFQNRTNVSAWYDDHESLFCVTLFIPAMPKVQVPRPMHSG